MTQYTLLFFYPSSWRERLICFLGRMRYVHVSIVIPETGTYTESSFPHGVISDRRPSNDPIFDYKHDVLIVIGRTSAWRMADWAHRNTGIKYGLWDCVQAFFRRRLHIQLGGNPGGYECAEYASHFLMAADVPGLPVINVRYGITPDELYDIVRGAP